MLTLTTKRGCLAEKIKQNNILHDLITSFLKTKEQLLLLQYFINTKFCNINNNNSYILAAVTHILLLFYS